MPKKAVEYYRKAIHLREETNNFNDAIRIYFNLGFELIVLKEYKEAKEHRFASADYRVMIVDGV